MVEPAPIIVPHIAPFLMPAPAQRSRGRELRMLAAVKLFEMGRLSSGRAAELAGVSRGEFLLNLNRYQVFPLVAELADLENEHAQSH